MIASFTEKSNGLALRYRPARLSELVGQARVVNQLVSFFKSDHIPQAFVFTGVRGIGKTTTARIFAKFVNCQNLEPGDVEPCCECRSCIDIKNGTYPDVSEIDGASNTGVDDVRRIIDSVEYLPLVGRSKVYIIDECHMLTRNAWNALLKTLEEPGPGIYFILVSTELGKIPDTIKSRCHLLNFRMVSFADIKQHLINIGAPEETAELVASHSDGSVREAVMLYEKILSLDADKNIPEVLGIESKKYIISLLESLLARDYYTTFTLVEQAVANGFDFARICRFIMKFAMDLVVFSRVGSVGLAEMFGEFISSRKDILSKTDGIRLFFKLFRLEQDLAYRNDRDLFLAGVLEAFS